MPYGLHSQAANAPHRFYDIFEVVTLHGSTYVYLGNVTYPSPAVSGPGESLPELPISWTLGETVVFNHRFKLNVTRELLLSLSPNERADLLGTVSAFAEARGQPALTISTPTTADRSDARGSAVRAAVAPDAAFRALAAAREAAASVPNAPAGAANAAQDAFIRHANLSTAARAAAAASAPAGDATSPAVIGRTYAEAHLTAQAASQAAPAAAPVTTLLRTPAAAAPAAAPAADASAAKPAPPAAAPAPRVAAPTAIPARVPHQVGKSR